MPPSQSPAQPKLNGAYYGPPVTTTAYNRPTRRGSSGGGGGSCCCNPFACLFKCIFNCIYQILLTLFIILAVIALISWFIFRPNVPKFHVDDVTMTQFTHSESNDTLYYKFTTNMTFRNPNKRLGVYYDKIEISTMYHGVRFVSKDLDGFYLGHKKEKSVETVFDGQQVVVFGNGVKEKYGDEVNEGVYKIDLKLRLKIRFKVLWMKSPKFTPRFDCDLKVPLSAKGGGKAAGSDVVKFERTKCDFDW